MNADEKSNKIEHIYPLGLETVSATGTETIAKWNETDRQLRPWPDPGLNAGKRCGLWQRGKCLNPCMGGTSRLEKDGEPKGLAILGQETNIVGVRVSELE